MTMREAFAMVEMQEVVAATILAETQVVHTRKVTGMDTTKVIGDFCFKYTIDAIIFEESTLSH